MKNDSLQNIFETVALLPTIRHKDHRKNMWLMRNDLTMVLDHDVDILKVKEALDTIHRRVGIAQCMLVKRNADDPNAIKYSKTLYDMATYDRENCELIAVSDEAVIQSQWDNLDKPASIDTDRFSSRKGIIIEAATPTEDINAEIERQVEIIRADLHDIRAKQEADVMAERSFTKGDRLHDLHQTLNQMFDGAASNDMFLNFGPLKWLGQSDLLHMVRLQSDLRITAAAQIVGIPKHEDSSSYKMADLDVKAGDVVAIKPGDGYPEIHSPD